MPIKAIGKGAYGVVCSAKNTQTNEKVAIKKIGRWGKGLRMAPACLHPPVYLPLFSVLIQHLIEGHATTTSLWQQANWGSQLKLNSLLPAGNAFENLTDARRTLREIKLLRHLRHDNIIAVKDILRPPSRDKFNDVYLVYEVGSAEGSGARQGQEVWVPGSAGTACRAAGCLL